MTFNEYYRDHPPVHILFAAFLGVKPRSRKKQTVNDPGEIARFVSMFRLEG